MTSQGRPTTVAALVTGCSSGIGRATALALHDVGYAVYATARRVETLQDLNQRGIQTLALDVTDESSMRAAVERVIAEHDAVGVLVNNAGYSLTSTVEEASMDDVRKQFETNVFGLARMCQLSLPSMRARGWGRIVNISSMGGRITLPGGGFYHASKHAVEAISDALRLETAPFGVTVSVIQPGPVQSAFGDTAVATMGLGGSPGPYADFNRELAQRYATAYSGKSAERNVTPEAVASAVVRAAGDHPRPRYAVGVIAKSLITGRRLLPDLVWDRVVQAIWPGPRKTPLSR
ncbi:MAG: oxidoreductase [Candidatus Nanopelagicales bacterium]